MGLPVPSNTLPSISPESASSIGLPVGTVAVLVSESPLVPSKTCATTRSPSILIILPLRRSPFATLNSTTSS